MKNSKIDITVDDLIYVIKYNDMQFIKLLYKKLKFVPKICHLKNILCSVIKLRHKKMCVFIWNNYKKAIQQLKYENENESIGIEMLSDLAKKYNMKINFSVSD